MDLIFIGITLVYLLLHIAFHIGIKRSLSLKKANESSSLKVSVVVAARNEENIISHCISSLKKLNYDPLLTEIFLVNDKSEDRTKDIMLKETEGDNRFIVLDSNDAETASLKGKANALDTAINVASGELIFLTDADCEVHPDWIKENVGYYDDSTGMVCGFTNIKYRGSIFDKVQSLDLVYLLSLASSSSGLNNILSCIGNNITFRKAAYTAIGGYGSIDFSITEDLSLMRAINGLEQYNIKFPVRRECMVVTGSCPDVGSLLRQKKRWFKGGLKINFLGYILGVAMYGVNILLLTGFLYLPLSVYISCVLIKFISELLIILPVMNRLKLDGLIRYFLLYQVYFAWYGIFLPFFFLFGRKVEWKGRKF